MLSLVSISAAMGLLAVAPAASRSLGCGMVWALPGPGTRSCRCGLALSGARRSPLLSPGTSTETRHTFGPGGESDVATALETGAEQPLIVSLCPAADVFWQVWDHPWCWLTRAQQMAGDRKATQSSVTRGSWVITVCKCCADSRLVEQALITQ